MPYFNRSYASLDNPFVEDRPPAWYWRVLAFFSSWLILAGFISLPPLYQSDPDDLRASQTILSILTVILITAGLCLSAFLCFACRSAQWRVEAIFVPNLGSSFLGVLLIFYSFATSKLYSWRAAAIVGVVLGFAISGTFGVLIYFTYRKHGSSDSPSSSRRLLGNIWQRRQSHGNNAQGGNSFFGEAPVQIISSRVSPEDESTRQQMMNLLKQREDLNKMRSSQSSLRNTYNIELPPMAAAEDMSPHALRRENQERTQAYAQYERIAARGNANSQNQYEPPSQPLPAENHHREYYAPDSAEPSYVTTPGDAYRNPISGMSSQQTLVSPSPGTGSSVVPSTGIDERLAQATGAGGDTDSRSRSRDERRRQIERDHT